jgi:hypothetical protein
LPHRLVIAAVTPDSRWSDQASSYSREWLQPDVWLRVAAQPGRIANAGLTYGQVAVADFRALPAC